MRSFTLRRFTAYDLAIQSVIADINNGLISAAEMSFEGA